MPTELFIHKMSEHMETATIVRWLVAEGDSVEKYQVIIEVETDKVTADLEAPASGVLRGIRPGAEEGAIVPVGETIAFIAALGEEVPTLPPLAPGPGAAAASPAPAVPAGESRPADELRATPVARRIARELGVHLGLVTGSGPGGRIHEDDVQGYAAARVAGPELEATGAFEWLETTPAQRVTGQRMLSSVRDAPQFALSLSVDMARALAWREAQTEPASITVLLVQAVARTLADHPRANASFEHGRVKAYRHIDVGVAVGTDDGLVVPVIRRADRKPLAEIARELTAFQEKGGDMHFNALDLTGGTFTITNLGMYGIERFAAIVNPPQSAILAVGCIVKTPVVTAGDALVLRPMMALTLTVDHRVLDGVQAARFLADLKGRLERAEGLE